MLLALVVALVGPLLVDWTSYRAAFEREASLALGQRVQVLGEADMQLLPLPHLHFKSVYVGEDDAAPILVVDEFDIRIELLPLVQGRIEVVDMKLRSPTLQARFDEEGKLDWQRDEGRLWDLGLDKIKLNDVVIENGRIEFEDRSTGRSQTISSLNGTMEARSLIGPYKVESTFLLNGQPFSLMMSSGSASSEGMRLKSLLTPANMPVTLTMDGDVTLAEDGRFHYIGKTHLTNQIDGLNKASVPWDLTGQSDLTVSSLVLPQFEFSHGEVEEAYRLAGAGTLDFGANPRFDLVVSSRQLDMDRALGEGPNAPIDLQAGVSKLAEALTKMPLPPMPGHVGFDVPGVILGGGIIRNLQLDAELSDKGWQIETFEADLPGQTRFAMAGLFSRRGVSSEQEFAFEGEARLRSERPDAFAKWWLRDTPANGRLKPFDLSGQLLVKADRLSVSALDLDMDGDRASGRVDWIMGDDNASASLDIRLKADRLDLDAVQGIGSLLLANSSGKAAPLSDITLDIETDSLQAADFEGQRLAAKARLVSGALEIEDLVVEDFAGAYLSTKGRLDDLAGSPNGRLEGTLKADDLDGLAALLTRFLPDHPISDWFTGASGALAPADITFSVVGSGDGLKGDIGGMVGEGNVSAKGSLEGAVADWQNHSLGFELAMDNPNGQRLLSLSGMGNDLFDLPALSSTITINGVLSDGAEIKAEVNSADGAMRYQGDIISTPTNGLHSKGRLTITSEDITPYLMASGVMLSNAAIGLPVALQASINHGPDATEIADINGQWDGQPVVGSLRYETTITNRLVSGSLELGDVDGIWLGETVLGPGRLTSVDQKWLDTAFVAPIEVNGTLPLKLDLKVKARSLELAAPYILQQPQFGMIWREDSVAINNFSGLLQGGKVTGGLFLENVSGEGVLKLHSRVEGASLAPLIWARDGRSVATGQLDVNVNVESQGRSMAGLVSGLTGNGTFAVKDAVINYVNPQAFELVVRAVDAGLQLKEGEIANAFVSHMDAGSTVVAQMSGAFRVAGGAIRANNIEAEAEILQSRGNLMVDLPAQTLTGDWSIKVEPNEEDAVTGAQPEVGLAFSGALSQPQRVVDVAPFTGYLSIRAFEREVDRVERLQADIQEKERMRRLLRLYREKEKRTELEKLAAIKAAEEARLQAIEDEKRLEQERIAAEKERQAQLKKMAEVQKALEKRRQEQIRVAEEAKRAEEARKAAEEKARQEAEAARLAAEADRAERERLAELAKKAAEEEARKAAEAKRLAEEEAQRAEAARLEAERAKAEAEKAKEELARISAEQTRAQETLSEIEQSNIVELRPLGELNVIAGQTQDEVAPVPQDMPEVLWVLPRVRIAPVTTATPAEIAPAQPANENRQQQHNDLIEELLNSPDRIIQLD